MFAITHKIKCALDSKSKSYIQTEKIVIFAGYDYTTDLYVIIAGGLVLSFDRYVYTENTIKMYHKGHYLGQFDEISIW